MIMIQVALGGITRLTGSGLSITEWKPILGAFPPMNDAAWQSAFEKYKEIGQFKHINFDFTLSDFKFIYFWEWLHRLWGRIIGIVFLIPFIYFVARKMITQKMIIPMIILFLLGGLQAAIGWIMVMSGLNNDDVSVDHIRLTVHFIAALILLVYTWWLALRYLVPSQQQQSLRAVKKFNSYLLIVLTLQLIYGALMAGLKAGNTAPTWPDINGFFWPAGMEKYHGLSNLTHNPLMVQFIHRMLAYILFISVIAWYWFVGKTKTTGQLNSIKIYPLIFVVVQLLLGIGTVLHSPVQKELLWWGVAHQFVAMLLLLSITWVQYLSIPRLKR